MVSTMADFSRFAQMLANGGTFEGKTYLSPKTFELMTSDHAGKGSGVERDHFYFPGDGFGMGLGLAVRTDPGNAKPPPPGSLGELKWDGASGCYMVIDRKQDMFFVVLEQTPTNASASSARSSSSSMKRWRTEGFTQRCLVAAALAVALVSAAAHEAFAESRMPPAPTFSRAALDRIGDTVRDEISSGKIPGAILLIQQHGKPVYFQCFGVRDPDTGQPMTPDTIFQIYSMSKAVTSVAAMMLVDDGKLSLDDPVSKYIGSFANAKVGVDLSDEAGQYPLKLEPLQRPITVRDLLRHTSGITYGFFGESAVTKLYANPQLYAGDFDNAEFADRIAILPLADQPGTRWNYSHSTDVLGRVVEVASGRRCFNSKSRDCSIRSACSTPRIMSRIKRSGRASRGHFRSIVFGWPGSGIRQWHGAGNPAVQASSRQSGTTPASCKCC